MDLLNFLGYAFIQKAYLAGSFVAALSAVLGMFLVLKKLSLIGDGLSHASFGGLALGLFLGLYPFYVAIPVALVASWLVLRLSAKDNIYGDAAIGIVSAVGIAGGVILASLSSGFNVDLFSYLFGNILAISSVEVLLSVALSAIVLITVWWFYQDLFAATFDEEYAKTIGVKINLVNHILIFLTAIAVVLAVKVVGVMLVSALLILPAVTALKLAKSFGSAIILAVVFAVWSVLTGITLSLFLNWPAGATVVLVNFFLFVLISLWPFGKK